MVRARPAGHGSGSFRLPSHSFHNSRSASAMWCPQCQLDVRGVVTPDDPTCVICPDCRQKISDLGDDLSLSAQSGLDADLAAVLGSRPGPIAPQSNSKSDSNSIPETDCALALDAEDVFASDWDEQLQALQLLIDEVKSVSGSPFSAAAAAAAHAPVPQPNSTGESASPNAAHHLSWATWLVISSGLMLFICGAVLVVWSVIAARGELWRIGLPIAFIGQVTLVLAIVVQLDALWIFHRQAQRQLGRLDSQLQHLQQVTPLDTPQRSGAAQAFYAHPPQRSLPSANSRMANFAHREQPE